MKKRIRVWAIRQGLINPKNLKESQEVFKFPVHKDLGNDKGPKLFWQLNIQKLM